jgi:hypothetical protein
VLPSNLSACEELRGRSDLTIRQQGSPKKPARYVSASRTRLLRPYLLACDQCAIPALSWPSIVIARSIASQPVRS